MSQNTLKESIPMKKKISFLEQQLEKKIKSTEKVKLVKSSKSSIHSIFFFLVL